MPSIKEQLTEDHLRAFNMCPRYYNFGGTAIWPDTISLLKITTERAISECVRTDKLDPSMQYMKALLRTSKELGLDKKYLPSQVQKIHTKVGLALGEIFESLLVNDFFPVFGPTPWRIKIGRTSIQMSLSGIMKSDEGQLHLVDFSPYPSNHGIKNDIACYLKAKTFRQHIQPFFEGEEECFLHVFGLNEVDALLYHKISSLDPKKNALDKIQNIVTGIDTGVNFPVLPCMRACPFKTKCFLESE